MADDKGVNAPEEQSQDTGTPPVEQQVQVNQVDTGDAPKGNSPESIQVDELGLPEGASERTRQRVQELLEENKKLKTQVLPIPEPAYEPITPIVPFPVGGVPPKTDEFGNVNPAYVEYIEARVAAREQAEINNAVKAEAREAESAHPDIKTNQALLNMARGVKTDSIVYPEDYGGRELSLKEALDFVKSQPGKTRGSDTQEVDSEKEQASLGIEGRPTQGVQRELSDSEFDSLRWATAKGNKDAMIARMKNIAPVNKR